MDAATYTSLIQGTLDMLILKTLSYSATHGFVPSPAASSKSRVGIQSEPGSAPHRTAIGWNARWLDADWPSNENSRRARII